MRERATHPGSIRVPPLRVRRVIRSVDFILFASDVTLVTDLLELCCRRLLRSRGKRQWRIARQEHMWKSFQFFIRRGCHIEVRETFASDQEECLVPILNYPTGSYR
jgi:hypothetical protein